VSLKLLTKTEKESTRNPVDRHSVDTESTGIVEGIEKNGYEFAEVVVASRSRSGLQEDSGFVYVRGPIDSSRESDRSSIDSRR